MNVYAPAMGLTSDSTWLSEHLQEMRQCGGGHAFPDCSGPWGFRSHIERATALVPFVISQDHLRSILSSMLALPPLAWDSSQISDSNVSGHSFHRSAADFPRVVGSNPTFPPNLSRELAAGFGADDFRELGHWLRDAKGQTEARPKRGSGLAQPPGAQNARSGCALLYSSGEGRLGEWAAQLRLRGAVIGHVRAAIRHWGHPIEELAARQEGWEVLLLAPWSDIG